MKCRSRERDEPQAELFKVELTRFLDMEHPMVKLAERIEWKGLHEAFDA